MTGRVIKTRMPTERFKEDPKQPRKHFDVEELRLLGQDMLENGQFRAMGALPDGSVIYGGRQLRAALMVGIKELDVNIYQEPLTDLQIRGMQWSENELQVPLSDPEKSDFLAETLRQNPTMTQQELAVRFKKSKSTITHLLAVFKCIQPVPAPRNRYRLPRVLQLRGRRGQPWRAR